MAISTTWVPFINGATGAAVRTALNTFNTNILSDMVTTEGRVTAVEAINGTQTTNITTNAANIATNVSDIASVATRVTALEASHELLLIASSVASVQQPSTTDTPLQIEFGPLQTTTDIDISAAGAITFKTAGKYIISPFFQYGRTGAAGTSVLLNRYLRNGVQEGDSLAAKIDNSDTLVPWSSSIQFTASINDVLTIEVMRDSTGDNSGGLFALNPTLAGWANAPCASIQIYKAT